MTHIRQRLEPEPSKPRYFITEPGMGYRFQRADLSAETPDLTDR
jgi:two-component system KDP operon response regulator KdpE